MEFVLTIIGLLVLGFVINLIGVGLRAGAAGVKAVATGQSFQESFRGIANLQMRLVDRTFNHDSLPSEAYKAVEIKGLLPSGFGMNLEVVTKIYDTTDTQNPKFVLSMLDSVQEENTVVFEQRTSLGYVSSNVGFKDWVEIARIFPSFVEPCRSGLRKITVSAFFGSLGDLEFTGGHLISGDAVDTVTDSFEQLYKEGYEEREELAEKGNQLVIELAMNVAMADGSLADAEGNKIKQWIEKSIAPYSDSKKERLKGIYNETLKTSYKTITSTGLNLDRVLTRLKGIDSDKIKYDAIALCYQVMSADGSADKAELKVLKDITEALDMDSSEVERIRDKHLLEVATPSASELSVESMLGISPDWDKERIRAHLTSEFQKWNNRLTTLDEGAARDNAQHMLDKIAEARRTYGL